YQRFLFDKFTRGIMAESLINEYERQHTANPDIPSQKLADDIGHDVNNFFGNIGRRKGLPMLGTTGTAVGQGLLFMFGLTQAINLWNRRQPTWMNEEKEHKLDAWIPSFGASKEGFWLSPMAIWNEVTHDLYRFAMQKPTFADAVDQVAANKVSPIFRAAAILGTGRTGMGELTTTIGGRIKEAAKPLIPIPLTF